MNAHTQTSREAEYERVTFEVRGTKHVMACKGPRDELFVPDQKSRASGFS